MSRTLSTGARLDSAVSVEDAIFEVVELDRLFVPASWGPGGPVVCGSRGRCPASFGPAGGGGGRAHDGVKR